METIMRHFRTRILFSALTVVLVTASPLFSRPPRADTYYIQSASEFGRSMKGFFDIKGTPNRFKKGQNVCLWELTKSDARNKDRQFWIYDDGRYQKRLRCKLNGNGFVNVDGGRNRNGTNIELWSKKTSSGKAPAQLFKLKWVKEVRGFGKWKIYTSDGKIVCPEGSPSRNGTNVHIWDDSFGSRNEWVLISIDHLDKVFEGVRTRNDLARACWKNNKYRGYFSKTNHYILKFHNHNNKMKELLTSQKPADMYDSITGIVKAASKNQDSSARSYIYENLAKINYSSIKGDIHAVVRKNILKRYVNRLIKKEKSSYAKSYLKQFKTALK